MTVPARRPNIATVIRDIIRRVDALERSRGARAIAPVAAGEAVTVPATVGAWTTTHLAYIAARGSVITWSVLVTPAAGASVRLQLQDDTGAAGAAIDGSGGGVVTVTLPVSGTWVPGEGRMVNLRVTAAGASTTVLPVAAVIA